MEKKNVYVGNRYVPKIFDVWDKEECYEPLSIVTWKGASYTSKIRVPIGVDIKNEKFWALTGNYNAQVDNYRKEVKTMKDEVNQKMQETTEYVDGEIIKFEKRFTHVTYDMFKEEGKSDEEIIMDAHLFANEHNLDVINLTGSYHLGKGTQIPIKTNVKWGNTKFFIDESAGSGKHFVIEPSIPAFEPGFTSAERQLIINGLKKGNNVIRALESYKNHFMIFRDTNDVVAKRYMGEDSPTTDWVNEEYVYIGEGGVIDGGIYNEFNDINEMEAIYAEDNYLTISGGSFILNGEGNPEISDGYNAGGISIRRSKTIIENQYVGVTEDRLTETDTASSGFYNYSKVYDITFKNIHGLPRKRNSITNRGTYGFEGSRVINLTFDNVHADGNDTYWGVTGNNKIKNLIVRNSNFNRIDVHFDARKVTIYNSFIREIELNGGDTLLLDNVEGTGHYLVNFRRDYGGSWEGDISVLNSKLNVNDDRESRILLFDKDANFNFPQKRYSGLNILINNFTFDFGGKDVLRNTEFITYNGVSTSSYEGSYIFNNLTAKNIYVLNNENELAGLNLLRLFRPYNLKTLKEGNYESYQDYNEINTNVNCIFENIQTNKDFSMPQSNHSPSVYLQVNSQTDINQFNSYSPYINMSIKDCKNLDLQLKGAPIIVNVLNSEISQMDCLEGGESNSILNVVNTVMNPVYNGNEFDTVFHLPKHATFTNTSLNPIIINGEIDLERSLTENGLVTFELNENRIYTIAHKLDISVSPLIRDKITEVKEKNNDAFADALIIACQNITQFKKYAFPSSGVEEDLPDIQTFHYNYGTTYYDLNTRKVLIFTHNGWEQIQLIGG